MNSCSTAPLSTLLCELRSAPPNMSWTNGITRLKAILYDLVVPCPGNNLTDERPERRQPNPRLRLFLLPILCEHQQCTTIFPSHSNFLHSLRYRAYRVIPRVVYEPSLLL